MKRISGILTGLSFLVLGVACGNGEDMDSTNSTNSTSTNCVSAMPANTIYVAADSKAASPDGTTWSKAFKNLQPAIDAGFKQLNANKVTRVTIAVKQGTYQPTGSQNLSGDFVNSLGDFRKVTQADIWGGFKGQSLCKEDQDKTLFEKTILSGVIAGTNAKKPDQKNALHVLDLNYTSGTVTADLKITGFKITGGKTQNNTNHGGGIGINTTKGAGIFLDNIIFDNNIATGSGGAVSITDSIVTITNSKFNANQALEGGGAAIRHFSGKLTLKNSTFTNNTAVKGGSAVQTTGELIMEGYTKDKLAPFFTGNKTADITAGTGGTITYK